MQEMYAATVNSVYTQLFSAVNSTTTSLIVKDSTVLPTPPTILVLGYDTLEPETVKVTNMVENELTIERAFQGTAKAWGLNTKIARIFTAYDFNAFKTNIEELETGTNTEFVTTNKFIDSEYVYFVGDYGSKWRVNRYDITNQKMISSGEINKPSTLEQCQGLVYV